MSTSEIGLGRARKPKYIASSIQIANSDGDRMPVKIETSDSRMKYRIDYVVHAQWSKGVVQADQHFNPQHPRQKTFLVPGAANTKLVSTSVVPALTLRGFVDR